MSENKLIMAGNWEKAKKIFAEVRKLSPELRPAYLDEVCADDTETRREIESLLLSLDDAESFMESPAAGKLAGSASGDNRKLESGKIFTHYEIIRQIGVGGMGEVYLAKDTRLDRQVAIKILNEQYSRHESNLDRFIQEAKSASALNHPNILVVHEIGVSENFHYIVNEFINGKTLREILNEKTLTISEILDIAVQIANALTAAHEARLVHRDIKPENIMIRPDGFVKVLDFGLAKLIAQKAFDLENSTVRQNETAKGVILGTVNYMSPEQAKGERVDERTDIFSFGVLLYEMLTGRTPFAGDSISETFANLINKEPPPVSRFAADLPNELQRIVSKTLRKKKDERFQTMKDLFSDLKSLQKRLEFEIEFEKKTSFDTTAETEELNAEKENSVPQNSIAVLSFANISADAENEYFCEGLAEELINALSKIEDLRVAARTSAFSFKNKDTEISEIGKVLNVGKILEGSVRKSDNRLRITVQLINAKDGFHIWSERFDGEMKDIFDLQDEITLTVIDKLKVKFLSEEKAAVLKHYTNNPEAYQLFLKGRFHWYKQTPESIRKSRDYFQQAIELDPTYAPGYAGLSEFYGVSSALGMMPPDEGWQKAEAAMARAQELDDTLPEVHNGLAAIRMFYHRDWETAERELKRTIELNPNFAEVHNLYSAYFVGLERLDEAVAESRRSLEIDPLSATYHLYLGNWLYFTRQYDEAVAVYWQVLELDAHNIAAYEKLGEVYERKKMNDEAVAAWRQVMMLTGDAELAAILDKTYSEDGFTEAVRAVARKKIERSEEKIKKGVYVPMIEFARLHLQFGDKEQAFHWLERAVDERNLFPLLINSDPFYDALRGDPRFNRLIKRIGIPVNKPDNFENAVNTTGEKEFSAKTDSENPANGNLTAENLSRTSSMIGSLNNRKYFYAVGLIILLAAAGLGYYFWSNKNTSLTNKKTLAVLPFINAGGDPNAEYLSDGITEIIINNLSQISDLKVMSKNSAFRFKNNQTDIRAIASQLGVETLVTGDIKQIGDKFVINIRLINADDDSQIWGNQYVKTTDNIFVVQNEIAQAVAGNLRVILTDAERRQINKKPTDNFEAYQLYLQGRANTISPNTSKAINYFQRAIDIDPNYAPAYAGLASAYRTLVLAEDAAPGEIMPKAKAAAMRAIALDNQSSEAHAALGTVAFFYEWNWNEAEKHFLQALELNPNNADAHFYYSHLLSNLGRHEESLSELKTAIELDPLYLGFSTLEGQFLFYAGKYDEAIDRLKRVGNLEPNFWLPHLFISRVYIEKEMFREAVEEATKARELSGGNTEAISFIGYALAKSGEKEKARETLEELKKLSTEKYVPPLNIGLVYNALGETDDVFKSLENGFQVRDVRMTFLKVDPKWNNLRNDPRFIDLMRRMNF